MLIKDKKMRDTYKHQGLRNRLVAILRDIKE